MKTVAVYGTLRKDQYNHGILQAGNAKYIGTKNLFGLELYAGEFFPMATISEFKDNSFIVAELYEVDSVSELSMDMLEGVDYEFPEQGLYRKENIDGVLVYIYNGDTSKLTRITDWVEHYKSLTETDSYV